MEKDLYPRQGLRFQRQVGQFQVFLGVKLVNLLRQVIPPFSANALFLARVFTVHGRFLARGFGTVVGRFTAVVAHFPLSHSSDVP